MNGTKFFGAVLLAVGLLALAYGGFTYNKKTEDVKLGPIRIEMTEKKQVNVPLWLGMGVAIVGGVLLSRRD